MIKGFTKILCIVPALLSAFASAGQITMNTTYTPVVGDNFSEFVISDTSYQPGPSGAAVSWNFASMSIPLTGSVETWINPSIAPYGNNYSGANIAVNDLVSGYDFFQSSPGGIQYKGMESIYARLIVSNAQNIITYPFTYGDSVSNTSVTGIDSLTWNPLDGRITSFADGYGTLQLATGPVNNVLRVKTVYDLVASSGPGTEDYFYTEKYSWYVAGTKQPVMIMMTFDKNHGASFHNKVIRIGNVVTGISMTSPHLPSMEVFPNPSRGKTTASVMLNGRSVIVWTLFNEAGEYVFTKKEEPVSGDHKTEFDFGNLNCGIYFLSMCAGDVSVSKKIMIE